MSEEPVRKDLQAVEAALASLHPAPCGVDRDRMMFLAGRASAEKISPAGLDRRASWLWPCATAATALVAVTFATLWLAAGGRQAAERDAGPPRPVEAEGQQWDEKPWAVGPAIEVAWAEKNGRTGYFQLRQLVLKQGVDALPRPRVSAPREIDVPTWRPGQSGPVGLLLEG